MSNKISFSNTNTSKSLLSLVGILLLVLVLSSFDNSFFVYPISKNNIVSNSQIAQSGGSGPVTYYVSTSGDDANIGTIDQPWKTFDRAFDKNKTEYLHGGDTLYLRGGIYHVNERTFTSAGDHLITDSISGNSGQPTKISSYPGERASLYLSARADSGWVKYDSRTDANIWYIDWSGYVHDNYPWSHLYSGITNGLAASTRNFIPQVVAIDSQTPTLLQEVNSAKNAWYPPESMSGGQPPLLSVRTDQSNMIAGDFYYESDSSSPDYGKLFVWLPDGSEPNGKPLEVSLARYIALGQQHDLVISDLNIRYGSISSFIITGSNIIFDNNNFSYMGVVGLNGTACSPGCIVRNSTFYHNGDNGSGIIGNGMIYERNTFDDNNYRRYNPYWHSGNMKLIPGASNMIIRDNIFKNSILGPGLWFDSMGSGQTIERNRFINNGLESVKRGLMIEVTNGTADKPNIIRNNIFDNNSIYISASQYTYVYNNAFYRGGVAIHGIEGTRTTVSNNKILNNIFYGFTGAPIFIVQDPPAPFVSVNNISDYNIFYPIDIAQTRFGGDFAWNSPFSLASWKAKGFDNHSLFIDPQLTDPTNGNFMPKSNSPVIDAGINISEVAKDINDNPRPQDGDGNDTTTIDIGPYELPKTTVAPSSIPGSCGINQNSCNVGTFSDVADSATNYLWQCLGSNGGAASSCSLPIIPILDNVAPVISFINTSNLNSSGVTISWSTNENSDTQIQYGLTSSYGNTSALNYSFTNSHSQTLSGLQSNTTYHYKVISKDPSGNTAQSNDQVFVTPNTSVIYTPPVSVPIVNQPFESYIPITSIYTPNIQRSVNTKVVSIRPTRIERNLNIGDVGADVKLLQETLNILGYAVTAPNKETNIFDKATQKALADYQLGQGGLESTGILDNATLALINKEIQKINQEQDIYLNSDSDQRSKSFLNFFIERVVDGFWKVIDKIKSII